jgi:hypothetical protein
MGCPISFEKKIDSHILRINAVFYILFTILSLVFNSAFFVLPLIIIFIIKNIDIQKICLIDKISKYIKEKVLKIKEDKLIDPAPKKVANIMGLFGSIMLFTTNFFDLSFIFVPYTVMLTAFTLEVIFEYCVGCQLYKLYNQIFSKS